MPVRPNLRGKPPSSPSLRLLAVAACLSFSMWFYVNRILIPFQVSDAEAHERPRGNLSDLYPRWLGARELWLHGRNPYSAEVTREIQAGYYGRVLDPLRPGDPRDQQGFAYPVYVVFLLAPTLRLPFDAVRVGFTWLSVVLTVASVLWWLRALRWRPGWVVTSTLLLLTLGSFGGLQGLKLQQLSLVVAALLAACGALLAGGHLFAAGALLAIATVKPQLVVLMAAFLTVWAVRDWRARRPFLYGFGLTLAVLCVGAQWLLPGWIGSFWQALHEYERYTGGESRLDVLLGPAAGRAIGGVIVACVGLASVRASWLPANHPRFALVMATVLVATLVVMPNFAPYNDLMILPAVLLTVREAGQLRRNLALSVAAGVAGFFLSWGWIAAIALTVASIFEPSSSVQRAWTAPLRLEIAIAPAFLLVLAILLMQPFPAPSEVQ